MEAGRGPGRDADRDTPASRTRPPLTADAHHRPEGGLRRGPAVEQQGVLGVLPGEAVEPAPAVVEVPEGHAADRLGAVAEQPEQVGVLAGLALEQLGRAAAGQGVGLGDLARGSCRRRPTRAPRGTRPRSSSETITFRPSPFIASSRASMSRERDAVDLPVPLDADGADGDVLARAARRSGGASFARLPGSSTL